MPGRLSISEDIAVLRITLSEPAPNDFAEIFAPALAAPVASQAPPIPAAAPAGRRDPEELRASLEQHLEHEARDRLGDVTVKLEFQRGTLEVIALIVAAGKLVIDAATLLGALREIRSSVPAEARQKVEAWLGRTVRLDRADLQLGAGLLAAEETDTGAMSLEASFGSRRDLIVLAIALFAACLIVGFVAFGAIVD